MQRKFTILLLISVLSISLSAQTVVWSGLGDGISWDEGANWVGNSPPGENSIVEITGDSVIVEDKYVIKQLKLLGGGILVQISPNDGVFVVDESSADGVSIDGSSKLYVDGIMEVNNSNNNGILIEANGSLIIKPDRTLNITNTNEDGIKGIVGSNFYNEGNITLVGFGTDGIDVVSFYNAGKIFVYDNADSGIKVGGSAAVNDGVIDSYDAIILQNTGVFTNTVKGEIYSQVAFSLAGDFENNGLISCRNTSGISMALTGNSLFHNTNEVTFRNSSGTNLKVSASHEFLNDTTGRLTIFNNNISLSPNAYAIELIGEGSQLTNYGLVNLDVRNRKNGIWMDARTVIQNDSVFFLKNYYEKGIVTNVSTITTDAITNNGKAVFKVTGGSTPTATSLILTQRNRLINDECADFVMSDSLHLSGIAVKITNNGYLEVPQFFKNSQAIFENGGAVFLSDSALATNVPGGYISQINNTGLVYHMHEGPIITGTPVTSFFAAINSSNAEIVGNQIQILDNGLYTNSGTVNQTSNTWIPPANAAGEDSVYFNYRKIGSTCDLRRLTMPFVSPTINLDCSSAPSLDVSFTGTVSQLWNIAGNWSNNSLPRPCDNVTIPNGKKAIINAGEVVNINRILVETGGVLDVVNGSLFEAANDY